MNNNETPANGANLYTEIKTGTVYESRLFETFVLMRPLIVNGTGGLIKLPLDEFGRRFEDFCGDRAEAQAVTRNEVPSLMIVK